MFSAAADAARFCWESAAQPSAAPEGDARCQHCGLAVALVRELFAVQHCVCLGCYKQRRGFYRQVPQGEAVKQFGVPLDALKRGAAAQRLAVATATSRNRRAVKLYYVFQLLELQKQIYGSEEAWLELKAQREEKRLDALLKRFKLENGAERGDAKEEEFFTAVKSELF